MDFECLVLDDVVGFDWDDVDVMFLELQMSIKTYLWFLQKEIKKLE